MKCSQCLYFLCLDGLTVCRRNPPTACVIVVPRQNILTGQVEATPQAISTRPPVQPDDWCGEFRASKEIIV